MNNTKTSSPQSNSLTIKPGLKMSSSSLSLRPEEQNAHFSRFSTKEARRLLSQPVAGITLLVLASITLVAPSQAQLPSIGSTAQAQVSSVREAAYTLGGGDRLRLDIFDVPEYSGEFQVLVDGTLNLPVVGTVSVQGLTVEGARQAVASRFAKILKRPVVSLSLVTPRPLKIAVAGEVGRPGAYTISLTEGQQFPTVTQAIQLAGGITQSAAVREVEVRRRDTRPVRINLWELLERGNLSQDITLRDGDEIYIPTVANVDLGESRQLADASFAAEEAKAIKVAVFGEVVRPGPYVVTGAAAGATDADTTQGGSSNTEPPTVSQAIQVAGGITQSSDIRNIEVRRRTRDGRESVIGVDLWALLQEGDLSQDVILQEGDTIQVPEAEALTAAEATELAGSSLSAGIINVNVVGEVEKAGAVQVRANAPLNEALLAAGGFDNRRARKKSVELVRLQPNGTVQKREIKIDFTAGINNDTNPPLRPNDVIIVRRSGLTRVTDTLGNIANPIGSFFGIFNRIIP